MLPLHVRTLDLPKRYPIETRRPNERGGRNDPPNFDPLVRPRPTDLNRAIKAEPSRLQILVRNKIVLTAKR